MAVSVKAESCFWAHAAAEIEVSGNLVENLNVSG